MDTEYGTKHMAFSPENPWILDLLQKGKDSRRFGNFDMEAGEEGEFDKNDF